MAKVNLHPDFKAFLESLNSAGVRYLVLGGYAVIHYGYRRVTDDLDVWIAVDPDNAAKLSGALQEFGGFTPSTVRPSLFLDRGKIFMFGREPVRIDVLTAPSGVEFEACHARRQTVDWDGVQIPLIALEDLKANKLASSRAKDLADLENLPTQAHKKPKRAARRRRPK